MLGWPNAEKASLFDQDATITRSAPCRPGPIADEAGATATSSSPATSASAIAAAPAM